MGFRPDKPMGQPPPFPKQEVGKPREVYNMELDAWARQSDVYFQERHRRHVRTMVAIAIVFGLLLAAGIAVVRADTIPTSALEYQGAFLLPTKRPPGVKLRWGGGADALTYREDTGTLIGNGHIYKFSVGESTIPEPTKTRDILKMNVAANVQPFGQLVGSLEPRARELGLDRVGGVAVLDGRVYWSLYRYYAVQPMRQIDDPTFGSTSLDFRAPDTRGLWKVGPYGEPLFHQKRTSNYLGVIPAEWAAAHVDGRRLAAGKGDGAGSAGVSHGPALYAVDVSGEPPEGGELPATVLLSFPPDRSDFDGWSACDRWEGFAWVEAGAQSAVVFAGRRGRGSDRYGSPADTGDPCGGGKGYHCNPYEPEFVFFDPDALALVASGQLSPNAVRPYGRLSLTDVFLDTCHFSTGGMAYDVHGRRLFLVQSNRERPVVHQWRVNGSGTGPVDDETPPEPPDVVLGSSTVGAVRSEFSASTRAGVLAKMLEHLAAELARELEP